MKKLFFLSTLTLVLFSLMTGLVNAQDKKRQKEIDKEATIKTLVDSRPALFFPGTNCTACKQKMPGGK